MFYDQFGMGIMNMLDRNAFGLSSALSTPVFTFDTATAPRFSGLTNLPSELIPAPPPGGPGTPPDAFSSAVAVNHNLRAPYSMNLTLSIDLELGSGCLMQVGYVGRLSRRLLMTDTSAVQQADFRDPVSGERLFDELRQFELHTQAGTPAAAVQPIGFFENVYSNAATAELRATQRVFEVVRDFSPDTGSALAEIDAFCSPFCSNLGPYAFFIPQFWGFGAASTIGDASHHSLQWTLRKRFSQGFQFDLNYTLSKSIDLVSFSQEQTGGGSAGNSSLGVVINNWDRNQQRGVSDFDLRHQLNADWVLELPFGRGKPLLSNRGGVVEAFLGGWQVSGLLRHTSGFPLSVAGPFAWPTNWCCDHAATAIATLPAQTSNKNAVGVGGNAGPNVFDDPAAALDASRAAPIGESGQRNILRGDGLFSIDLGLAKRIALPWESHSLQFRTEAFNLTNSVSFEGNRQTMRLWDPSGFGRYSSTLVPPRVL